MSLIVYPSCHKMYCAMPAPDTQRPHGHSPPPHVKLALELQQAETLIALHWGIARASPGAGPFSCPQPRRVKGLWKAFSEAGGFFATVRFPGPEPSQGHLLGLYRQPRDEISLNSNNMHINSIPNPWKGLLGVVPEAALLPCFTNTLHQLKTQSQKNPRQWLSVLWSSRQLCQDALLLLLLLAIRFLPQRWLQDINLLYRLIRWHYKGKHPSSAFLPTCPSYGPSVWLILFCHRPSICSSHHSISYFYRQRKKCLPDMFRKITFSCLPPPQLFFLPTK